MIVYPGNGDLQESRDLRNSKQSFSDGRFSGFPGGDSAVERCMVRCHVIEDGTELRFLTWAGFDGSILKKNFIDSYGPFWTVRYCFTRDVLQDDL